jgi:hypothetical protein
MTLASLGITNEYFMYYGYNDAIQDTIGVYKKEVCNDTSGFDWHTSLPIWSLSQSSEHYHSMRNDNTGAMTGRKSRVICQSSWKYCDQCVDEDFNKFGHSIWHVKHQLLGITHCVEHRTRLVENKMAVTDLRYANLPQCHEPTSESIPENEDLLEWSQFVYNALQTLAKDPTVGFRAQERVKTLLQIPPITKQQDKDLEIFNSLHRQFEQDTSFAVLNHLFSMTTKHRSHKVNPLKLTMGFKDRLTTVADPIYWLAILFWLKNECPLVD